MAKGNNQDIRMTPLTNDVNDLIQLTKLLGLERQSFTIARIGRKNI